MAKNQVLGYRQTRIRVQSLHNPQKKEDLGGWNVFLHFRATSYFVRFATSFVRFWNFLHQISLQNILYTS